MSSLQKTVQSIASVSFLFFVVLGGLHISSSLLLAQDVFHTSTYLFWNALDLPFLLAALAYGTSQLSLTLEDITGNLKIPFLFSSLVALVVFAIGLYLNFGFPDAKLF